jgi:hypothetical protein
MFWCGEYRSRYTDSLRAVRSGDRIPLEARFSAPVQTGPGAHPGSYTTGTEVIPGGKSAGRGVNYPTPSSAEVKERAYVYSTSVPSWHVIGWTWSLRYLLHIHVTQAVLV